MPRKATAEYNLQVINPTVAKEWHPTKNGSLTPKDVFPNSHKKAWWICKDRHHWEASIANRNRGRGCPYCSGNAVCDDNCLQTVNPTLSSQWHPNKNGSLTPRDVTPGTHRKVWWICRRGHEWEASIANRNKGRMCPYCAGKAVCKDNCLQTINPALAAEWHISKNDRLTPRDVTPGTHRKVWWICRRGHEWEAAVYSRSAGNGCPYCHSQTSQLELRIYAEMKYLFNKVGHRKKVYGVECDIYVPEARLAIEVDGLHWHKDKYVIDREKTNLLKKQNITLLRVRENGLKRISSTDIFFPKNDVGFKVIRKIADSILKHVALPKNLRYRVKEYLESGQFANTEEYSKLLYMLPSPLPGLALDDYNKHLAKEWHQIKNGSLTPKDVTPNSGRKVWWLCGKGHEWKTRISHRTKGAGCPYCAGRLVSDDNCLTTVNPALANEWHSTRNRNLTAKDVVPNSTKRVWWICPKGHEWQATVNNRTQGSGCPYCSGQAVCDDNCLQTVNPRLAEQWYSDKNGSLTPKDVTSSSGKKVWWLCSRGHEWEATVDKRNNGRGCPYCAGKAVCADNCLQTVNPNLAAEWHPNRNGGLTPRDVTANSGKRIWWICGKSHIWKAQIASRNQGYGCPYCSRRRKS